VEENREQVHHGQPSTEPKASVTPRDPALAQPTRTATLLVATAAAVYLCWLIARPFIGVATWALALTVVARPWHSWLERRMRPNLAALVTVLTVALGLIGPAVWLGSVLLQELGDIAKKLDAVFPSGDLGAGMDRYPQIQRVIEWLQIRMDFGQELRRMAGIVAGQVSNAVRGSIWILTQVLLTSVTMFFFLRDRDLILMYLRRLSPLSPEETSAIFERASKTIGASLSSNLFVKLIQGILGGLMFWILGLPDPVLAGAAMALLALLPIMGTGLIWGPAALILAFTGSWIKAIVLALWGLFAVSLIDNVLYPILVAEELSFYRLAVFFAVFGGLIAFGFTGIVLGPLILAITVLLVEIWSAREHSTVVRNSSREH